MKINQEEIMEVNVKETVIRNVNRLLDDATDAANRYLKKHGIEKDIDTFLSKLFELKKANKNIMRNINLC